MKKISTLFAVVLASSIVSAQETYLCIPDGSPGISWKSNIKKWTPTSFNVEDQKFLLKKTSSGWAWSRFGDSYSDECGEILASGLLTCNILGGELRFNKKSLRYLETHMFGYVDGVDSNANTPFFNFGKCSPL